MDKTVYFNIVNPDTTIAEVYPGDLISLIKSPNKYDDESIEVWTQCTGSKEGQLDQKIGYVANSTSTVPLGTYSAGRLYDKLYSTNEAKIFISTNDHLQLRIGVVNIK